MNMKKIPNPYMYISCQSGKTVARKFPKRKSVEKQVRPGPAPI